jgi:hypothetical protein
LEVALQNVTQTEQNKLRNFLKTSAQGLFHLVRRKWAGSDRFDDKETGFRFLAMTYRFFSSPRGLENLGAHPIYFPMAKGKIFPRG